MTAIIIGSLAYGQTAYAADALSATSSNWAGYAVQNGSYTGVSGTWVIPELSYSTTLASNATWVGIGGRSSGDLIQAGVYEIAKSDGATYQAWYELLPDNSTPINLPVHPGDSISVAIIETSVDIWNVVITNNTSHQQFAKVVNYHSSRSSAEWIQERPMVNGAFADLSGFTPVRFSGATAVQNGQRASLTQLNPQMLNMIDTSTNTALAVPSPLNNDNTFSVVRTSATVSSFTAPAPIQNFIPTTIPSLLTPPHIDWNIGIGDGNTLVLHFRKNLL
jgi:hypothetical protein